MPRMIVAAGGMGGLLAGTRAWGAQFLATPSKFRLALNCLRYVSSDQVLRLVALRYSENL
jgi:hypothetical protein